MVRDGRYLINNKSAKEPTAATDTYDIDIEQNVKIDLERLCFPMANIDNDSVALILDLF